MKMPVSQLDKRPRDMLNALGFNDIEFSYDLKAAWQEATNLLSLQSGANLRDGGNLDINLAIGGLPRSLFENPQTAQSAVAFATLDKADVKFEDGSLVDKGLTLAGAMQGVNADTMKAQVVGMLPTMLKMLEKPAFVDQVTAAVKNFLDKKGTITATATPPAPVLILQLLGAAAGAPGAVVDLLNIKIEAGQL